MNETDGGLDPYWAVNAVTACSPSWRHSRHSTHLPGHDGVTVISLHYACSGLSTTISLMLMQLSVVHARRSPHLQDAAHAFAFAIGCCLQEAIVAVNDFQSWVARWGGRMGRPGWRLMSLGMRAVPTSERRRRWSSASPSPSIGQRETLASRLNLKSQPSRRQIDDENDACMGDIGT
jgi:hypothetical protein